MGEKNKIINRQKTIIKIKARKGTLGRAFLIELTIEGDWKMKSKMVSIFLCMVMVMSISVAIIQNLGPLSMNASGAGCLADSPWPMFRQNLNHTGVSPYDTSSNPGKLRWSFTTGDVVYSSPAIGSDGTIYIGSGDKKFYAINPDGTEKWNFPTDGAVQSSSAIYSNGTIYFGVPGTPIPYGLLYALNQDGTEIWSFPTSGDMHSSPAIGSDGTIYVGSDDYKLYAINPDGTEKWSFMTANVVSSSPAIGSDGTIYVGSQDLKLYAINPDGTEKWSFKTKGTCHSSPAIGSDGTIYVGSTDGRLYAIKPDGSENWNFTTGPSVWSSPGIGSDGTIYIGSTSGKFYAINTNGTEKWIFTTGANIESSPAISSDGTIYIGSVDNKLYAINPNGTEKWNFTTGHYVVSSPAIGSDGTIYVGSNDYKLYAIGTPNLPPTADAGSDQTVNVGDVVEFNGSASYDLDGTIVTYEWDFDSSDGLWWETGAPPDAVGLTTTHTYEYNGVYIVTLKVTDNNGSSDIDTCEITILVPPPLPPTLYINVSQDGEDVILYWEPLLTPGIKYYLIYRSTSQIDFDFNTVWVNTSKDNESGEPGPIPLRTMWNDTNAALPDNVTNYAEQYYYIIRSVNIFGKVSRTSRTVGKWTKTFPQGVSTFSIPLEPLDNFDTEWHTSNMNAEYIKYMNTTTHTWMQHNFGDGNSNNTQMKLGEGYEVKFDSQTDYTFTGMPGAMIMYDDDTGFIGFNPGSDARNLSATVDPLTGNVTLNWTQPSSKGVNNQYHVLRSIERDGFWTGNYVQLATLLFDKLTYTDIGNATTGTQYYYIIVPVNETGVEGASTYSIGVWTEEYLSQYDTIGIPLKLPSNYTADCFCENIPNTVGINYFIYNQQRWSWHSTRMPAGAYDPDMVLAEGYQISTSNLTKFTFIGV